MAQSLYLLRGLFFAAFFVVAGLAPSLHGATLVYAEYFIDTDPGQGLATSVLPCDGVFNEAEEDFCLDGIPVPALSAGRHILFLRLRDSDNRWFTRKTEFYICAANLVSAEYYFDTDPGIGNGTPILPCDGVFDEPNEDVCFDGIPVPALSSGRHILFLRLRDSDNRWFTRKTEFYVRAANLVSAEYYFDSDPGLGNGTPILPCDGVFDEPQEDFCTGSIPAPDLPAGSHTMFLRLTDSDGQVTLRTTTIFLIAPLEYAEYFIDVDPGQGNGVSLSSEDGTIDEAVESFVSPNIGSTALAFGQHRVFLRLRDSDDRWGMREASFYVSSANPYEPNTIAAAEYSIDGGIWQTMEPSDGFFDSPEELLTTEFQIPSSLSYGEHTVAVRAQDNFGNWGTARMGTFKVWEYNPYKLLIAAEYFADTDPGEGNGTPLPATDGAFDFSVEEAGLDSASTAFFELGLHQIYVRFRDNYRDSLGFIGWGPAVSKPLNVVDNFGFACGDFSGSNRVDIADAVYMVNYIFAGGPPPADPSDGDINCNGRTDIADVVYLVNYVFVTGSPEPCEGCPPAAKQSRIEVAN